MRDALAGPIAHRRAAHASAAKALGPPFVGQIDDLRLYGRVLDARRSQQTWRLHYRARAILSGVTGKRSRDEAEYLRDYFLTYAAPPTLRTAHAKRKLAQCGREGRGREDHSDRDGHGGDEEAARHVRAGARRLSQPDREGAARRAGDAAAAARDAPLNRLTLAKWLVEPKHPLTARVAVNRFWQMYFGYGIVKTQEDFGVQGEPPVHPELLDWLATEFVRTGWDIRAMQRLIVTSATYRQSSKVTPALLERIPRTGCSRAARGSACRPR